MIKSTLLLNLNHKIIFFFKKGTTHFFQNKINNKKKKILKSTPLSFPFFQLFPSRKKYIYIKKMEKAHLVWFRFFFFNNFIESSITFSLFFLVEWSEHIIICRQGSRCLLLTSDQNTCCHVLLFLFFPCWCKQFLFFHSLIDI